MKIILQRFNLMIIVGLLNIYLLLYVAKVYQLPFENDLLRLIITFLLCFFVIVRTFEAVFIKKSINKAYAFFLVYFIYILMVILLRDGFNTTTLITSLFFPLIFLGSYAAFSKIKNHAVFERIKKHQFFMVVTFFGLYFYVRVFNDLNNGMVINSVYYQVLILPFILLINNAKIRNIGIVLITISVLFSMKRAAFIAVAVALFIYIVTRKRDAIYNKKNYKKISAIVILVIAFLILNSMVMYVFDHNIIERLLAIGEDRGAGRLDILISIFSHIRESSIFEMLLGHGIYTTSEVTGGYTSHNDFVEMFWSYGLIGLIVYLGLYVVLIRYARLFNRSRYKYAAAFSASIGLFFTISLFSHLIFVPTYVGYLCLFWSFCITNYHSYVAALPEVK